MADCCLPFICYNAERCDSLQMVAKICAQFGQGRTWNHIMADLLPCHNSLLVLLYA